MSWQELTLIQTADGKNQCPVVDINNDGFQRVYYSHRDKNNHSYTSYIDVEPGNPQNLIKKSEQPILEPGVIIPKPFFRRQGRRAVGIGGFGFHSHGVAHAE